MRRGRGRSTLEASLDLKRSCDLAPLWNLDRGSRRTGRHTQHRIRPGDARWNVHVYRGKPCRKARALGRSHCQRCLKICPSIYIYIPFNIIDLVNSNTSSHTPVVLYLFLFLFFFLRLSKENLPFPENYPCYPVAMYTCSGIYIYVRNETNNPLLSSSRLDRTRIYIRLSNEEKRENLDDTKVYSLTSNRPRPSSPSFPI